MILPNLFIPRAGKSGTSSLHGYLNLHPMVCTFSVKEPLYFAIENRYKNGCELHNGIFSDCREKLLYYGESSTTYSLWKPALKRIKRDLESPKIILLMRKPVERLLSHYNWLWALGLEKRSLIETVQVEEKKGFHPDKSLRGNYA